MINLQAYRPAFLLKGDSDTPTPTQKFLRAAFLVEHLTVHYTFSKFYGYIIDIFHISCAIALISSMIHNYSVLIFTPNFSKCKFRTHYNVGSSTILIVSLELRNNSWIAMSSPSNLLWTFWILCFLNFLNMRFLNIISL